MLIEWSLEAYGLLRRTSYNFCIEATEVNLYFLSQLQTAPVAITMVGTAVNVTARTETSSVGKTDTTVSTRHRPATKVSSTTVLLHVLQWRSL